MLFFYAYFNVHFGTEFGGCAKILSLILMMPIRLKRAPDGVMAPPHALAKIGIFLAQHNTLCRAPRFFQCKKIPQITKSLRDFVE